MEKYRSDIINVLFNTIDTSIYVNNIADEMTELLYSDGDYLFFKQKAGDLLQGRGKRGPARFPLDNELAGGQHPEHRGAHPILKRNRSARGGAG